MTRKLPPPAPDLTFKSSDTITEVRSYDIITPLFGGGVDPQQPDPISVVRASEVRGQLRFWWRATRGGQFGGDLEKMRDAELALWGGPASFDAQGNPKVSQSLVQVVVESGDPGTDVAPFEVERRGRDWKSKPRPSSEVPSYAAFPLQPTDAELKVWRDGLQPKTVRMGVSFTLIISFPELHRKEVAAALWAWETFGGIGARTRRGFGALRLKSINNTPFTDLPLDQVEQAESWLRKKLTDHISAEGLRWHPHVPHLIPMPTLRLKIVQHPEGRTLKVWETLITALKNFRQRRHDKETGRRNAYGHSDWPEPNAIRRRFSKPTRGFYASRNWRKFPRAQFGLPIVFHMAHDSDIGTVTLNAVKTSEAGSKPEILRLASPLILKPLACRNGKALGLAAVLEGVSMPDQLILSEAPYGSDPVLANLSSTEANQIPPLNGEPDVIQAFLTELR